MPRKNISVCTICEEQGCDGGIWERVLALDHRGLSVTRFFPKRDCTDNWLTILSPSLRLESVAVGSVVEATTILGKRATLKLRKVEA